MQQIFGEYLDPLVFWFHCDNFKALYALNPLFIL